MLLRLGILLLAISTVNCELKISADTITMQELHVATFEVEISNSPGENPQKTLILVTQYDDLMTVVPSNLQIDFGSEVNITKKIEIKLYSFKAGKTAISVFITSPLPHIKCLNNRIVNVNIYKNTIVNNLSKTFGWMYFIAWSLSFYPQIYSNNKRKSVEGLSFDFMVFNLYGYIAYTLFNTGMYFIPTIKHEYAQRHPRSVNPVYGNDILFSMHSLIATTVTMIQCLKYGTNDQTVSGFAHSIIGIDTLTTIAFVILTWLDITLWLDVLYACSFVKLVVTITKYIPQVYMNYRRKTTQGWSIASVVLDFTGGLFCLFQVFLDSYNYVNWKIGYDNPTKFGLGFISVVFDLIFLTQHYCIYRNPTKVNDIAMPQISGQ